MKLAGARRRKAADWAVRIAASLGAAVGIVFLVWILWEVVSRGASALSWSFFTELPAPPGEAGGGLANAILGTVLISAGAGLLGVPAGIMAGIYLAEYGQGTRFGGLVGFMVNVMMGVPSIIAGLFVYTLIVVSLGHFSGYAGAVALALLMLPIVARTTADMMALVPDSLRESALALGAPRWRVIVQIVARSARSGLLTGILLAVARVSGETAPLLFTALNSPYWPHSFSGPTANLTVTIFNYAMSPYRSWQQAAWGASFVITAGVLAVSLLTRYILRRTT
ncbi:MAG: phosphate ABC transporter permease PstA [Acidobacteria bacterium]|nr:phosphate ABC transporter permease PstA [Acidobacteriota bacterium]